LHSLGNQLAQASDGKVDDTKLLGEFMYSTQVFIFVKLFLIHPSHDGLDSARVSTIDKDASLSSCYDRRLLSRSSVSSLDFPQNGPKMRGQSLNTTSVKKLDAICELEVAEPRPLNRVDRIRAIELSVVRE
jgi:hypothetical protein